MEIKEVFREDSIIMKKDEYESVCSDAKFLQHYVSIETMNGEMLLKSKYNRLVRELEEDEIVLICKYEDNGTPPNYTPDLLIDKILKYFDNERNVVFCKKRERKVLYMRQIVQAFLYLCGKGSIISEMSYDEIGRLTGYFHHGTVMNSIKKVKNYYDTEKQYRVMLDNLMLYLKIRNFIIDDLQRV